MSQSVIDTLSTVLANTYALFLKTQNYHWHVKGPHFKPCHELFETQYRALFEAIDALAERILTLGGTAPASFEQFSMLANIKAGNAKQNSNAMLKELAVDHGRVIESLRAALEAAQTQQDEGSIALIGERIAEHEKQVWMLHASLSD